MSTMQIVFNRFFPKDSPILRILGMVGAAYTSKSLKQPFRSISREIEFLLDLETGGLTHGATLMVKESDTGQEGCL